MSGSRGADTLCCEGGLPTGLAAGLGAVAILALGCGSPPAEPDGSWAVTVTGLETDCTDSSEGYQKSFTYQLFYDETDLSLVELRIDDESFATGFVKRHAAEPMRKQMVETNLRVLFSEEQQQRSHLKEQLEAANDSSSSSKRRIAMADSDHGKGGTSRTRHHTSQCAQPVR